MLNTAANTSSIVRSVAGALQVFHFPGGRGPGQWETGNSAFLNARRTADTNPALCAFKFFDLQGISPGGLPCHLFSWMPRLALTSFACRPSLVFRYQGVHSRSALEPPRVHSWPGEALTHTIVRRHSQGAGGGKAC